MGIAESYWKECVSEAFEDAGITATSEQIDTVASMVEGAHDTFSMAFGPDCIPNPLEHENNELKRELKKEHRKVFCEECDGKGSITTFGPCHSATSECSKCRGEGRHIL